MSLYLKKNIYGIRQDQDLSKYLDQLTIYEKCHSIQTAKYLRIDENALKRKIKESVTEGPATQILLQNSKDLKTLDPTSVAQNNKLEVELNYFTHHQVGRKRENLFNKKLQYYN